MVNFSSVTVGGLCSYPLSLPRFEGAFFSYLLHEKVGTCCSANRRTIQLSNNSEINTGAQDCELGLAFGAMTGSNGKKFQASLNGVLCALFFTYVFL